VCRTFDNVGGFDRESQLTSSRALVVALTTFAVGAAGSIASAASSGCKLVKVEDWPVRVQHNHVLVEGAINGQKVGVLLDTGASRTVIFRAAAVRLGVPLSGSTNDRLFGIGGETKVDLALVDEFRVGQAAQKQLRILVAGEHDPGDDVGVLLGEDFFQRFDVEFDLAHNAVRLFQPQDCDRASLAYWERTGASEVGFESLDVNQPQVILTVRINGEPLKALLDSGAGLSMLDKSDAERVGVTPDTPGVVVGLRGTCLGTNAVDVWIGPFLSFAIGDEMIRDTQIRFSDMYKDARYRTTGSNLAHKIQVSYSMLLGADFLRSHRVLIAHSQRKVYFSYVGGPVFQLNRPATPANDSSAGERPTTDGN